MNSLGESDKPCASDLSHHLSRGAKHHHPDEYEIFYRSRAQQCLTNPNAYQLAANTQPSRNFCSDNQPPKDQNQVRSSIRRFIFEYLHPDIPYANPDVAVQRVETDSLSEILRLLCDEWYDKRDWQGDRPGLLVEEYTHIGVTTLGESLGVNIVPVGMDAEGMLSYGTDGLEENLRNWKTKRGKRPHMMYTIPSGQISTGRVTSLERKKQIYTLCQNYDVIIIEAGSYSHLQYSRGNLPRRKNSSKSNETFSESSKRGFLDSLVPSYLPLDNDGRVIKLDSSLAGISSCYDMTFIVAQASFIEHLRQTSGVAFRSQFGQRAMDHTNKTSSVDDFDIKDYVEKLESHRSSYEERMNRMSEALDLNRYYVTAPTSTRTDHFDTSEWLHLDSVQMYTLSRPDAGAFIWIRIHFSSHPLACKVSGPSLSHALWTLWTSRKYSMLVLPGELLAASKEIAQKDGWQFFGLCFGNLPTTQVHGACATFTDGLREFWEIEDEASLPTIQ